MGATAGMDQSVFDGFRQIIYAKSGILLRDGKETLVQARIAKRMRKGLFVSMLCV